mmetsp:Transcript_36024/g.84673  ORF Transcript_36024/g.84673 Transcript_36024/m.84673 type:complete len:378 (-) Transcript_36024:325-1458(-)
MCHGSMCARLYVPSRHSLGAPRSSDAWPAEEEPPPGIEAADLCSSAPRRSARARSHLRASMRSSCSLSTSSAVIHSTSPGARTPRAASSGPSERGSAHAAIHSITCGVGAMCASRTSCTGAARSSQARGIWPRRAAPGGAPPRPASVQARRTASTARGMPRQPRPPGRTRCQPSRPHRREASAIARSALARVHRVTAASACRSRSASGTSVAPARPAAAAGGWSAVGAAGLAAGSSGVVTSTTAGPSAGAGRAAGRVLLERSQARARRLTAPARSWTCRDGCSSSSTPVSNHSRVRVTLGGVGDSVGCSSAALRSDHSALSPTTWALAADPREPEVSAAATVHAHLPAAVESACARGLEAAPTAPRASNRSSARSAA